MKLTYDPAFNIAYITFREKNENVNSIKLSEEIIIDLLPDGTLAGVELLNANEQLNAVDKGKLVFIKQMAGVDSQQEILV
ncbi:MAG: DUF2283 domain-containing protein [Bacteroidetes bacterium]|nr:DUF2283 domain-containing protein [Bacteroidota bacterium]